MTLYLVDLIVFLALVNDFSSAVWVYLLANRKEVFKIFMSFITMIDHQFSQQIKFEEVIMDEI